MPSSVITHYSDPDQYATSIRGCDTTVLVKDRGPFSAELTKIDLDRLWMQQGKTSASVLERCAASPVRAIVFFLTQASKAPTYRSGMPLEPSEITFSPPRAEYYNHSAAGYGWSALSLTPQDLADTARALVGHEVIPPSVTLKIRPRPALMSRLRHLHAAAMQLALTVPDVLTKPSVTSMLEHELVCAMVGCLTSVPDSQKVTRRPPRLPVMQRFEDILAANPNKPLHLLDVCAKIGVSDRTLRMHCFEHLGMSPHRYLWLRRMNQARRALSLADPQRTTVTEIAIDHGFWELGRFSVGYRKLFGDPPSITLRSSSRAAETTITELPPRT